MTDIYFDHAATTPVHPEVLQAMLPYFTTVYGNASSTHGSGRQARAATLHARETISQFIGCTPNELIFTSGGTESDNMALFGAAAAGSHKGKHIITSQIEHHAVLHACEQLEKRGYEVTYLPVDKTGRIKLEHVQQAIRPDTILISTMYANNEVGTIQPIDDIGLMARDKGILFHVDAVQALGHVPIDLSRLPVDLMSFSAHKIQGPKGIGALYAAKHVKLEPLLYGGNQERKRRAGTENTAAIAGFSKAVQIIDRNTYETRQKLEKLRSEMAAKLQQALGREQVVINGHPVERVPHILNVSFPGISTETMLMNLDLEGIAAASGSACTAGSLEVSHVLKAMRLEDEITRSAIRFSFGPSNSLQEIDKAVEKIATVVQRIRN
ncbi:cysteine desulfurase family protein [Paenibacillus xerothermodurans]|uniref:cysteine desulfurase n=1 Tax=Paenibacillus xerothermodurans TaxID=1977292 RepID=A0A2W1N3Z0_PAEXE|nr:cysteine desulfurase family protein [Paenibacillus xerothermodurans]PZE19469.1 cysteine desulfurase [Paenibacillus xerothermodurans]